MSKVYCPNLKTGDTNDSKVSRLVNNSDSDQFEGGTNEEIVEILNIHLSTISSEERLGPVGPQQQQ
jgi:hypothetical protein